MKQLVLVGALAVALAAGSAFAQQAKTDKAAESGGRTTPFDQPSTAPAPTVPGGEVTLGTVKLPSAVMADGKKLPAGTYQVRVTGQVASPDAKGQTASLERWMEFMQGGQVKGREVATIVPQSDLKLVEKDTPPQPNSSKFETLKGGDYTRLWINRGGNHYLVHFPTAS
jgi:hypothetical protein